MQTSPPMEADREVVMAQRAMVSAVVSLDTLSRLTELKNSLRGARRGGRGRAGSDGVKGTVVDAAVLLRATPQLLACKPVPAGFQSDVTPLMGTTHVFKLLRCAPCRSRRAL